MNRVLAIILFIVLAAILFGLAVLVIKKPKGTFSKPGAYICAIIAIADIVGLVITGMNAFFPKEELTEIGITELSDEQIAEKKATDYSDSKYRDVIIVRGKDVIINNVDAKDNDYKILTAHLKKMYEADTEVIVIDDYADFETYTEVINLCSRQGVRISEKDEKWTKE